MSVAECGQFATPVRRGPGRRAKQSSSTSCSSNTTKTAAAASTPQRCTQLTLPPSPQLTVLGYGTGVRVALLERSSPGPRGTYRSPWAVKQLSGRLARSKDPAAARAPLQRLAAEARVLRQLQHPCIVGYRGTAPGPRPGSVSLLMEAGGCSLLDLIERRCDQLASSTSSAITAAQNPAHHHQQRPFPLVDIAVVGDDVSGALDYLHRQQRMLHGDVKSANVLITGNFVRAKLCDFGVTLPLNDRMCADMALYVGTECWAAPEVISYQHQETLAADAEDSESAVVTDRADVFSLALTLWEMFALEMPHCPPALSDDDDEDPDELELEELDAEALMLPPPLPDYSDQVMNEYQRLIELYAVCVQQKPQARPSAQQCCQMFSKMRQDLASARSSD